MRSRITLVAFILLIFIGTTVPVQARQGVGLTIFIDEDSLTILVPIESQVSLVGIGFEVVIDGESKVFDLSQYEAFRALYFDRIPPSICLRLLREGSRAQLPQECPSKRTITQELTNADIFWYDNIANQSRTLILVQVSNPLEYCFAGTARCEAIYSPPAITPTPLPPPTDTPAAGSVTLRSDVLYSDDFSDNLWGWETADRLDLYSEIQTGQYVIDFGLKDFEYWVVAPGFFNFSDAPLLTGPYEFSFEVSNASSRSGAFSLVILFDVNADYDPYKRLYIESNGRWRLFEWSSQNGHQALASGRLAGNRINFIDGDTHAVVLRVETTGYTCFIDGEMQASIPAFGNIYGTIGFGLVRDPQSEDRITAAFDNVVIRALN